MDPLSMTATITQLIGLAADVLGKCYAYGCAVANAPKDMRKLVDDLTETSGILVALRGLAHEEMVTEAGKGTFTAAIQGTRETMLEILDILQSAKAMASSSTDKFERTVQRLLWPLKQKDTAALLGRLAQHKSSLTLILSTETAASMQTAQIVLNKVYQGLEEDRVDRKSREALARRAQACQWLCRVDYESMHASVSSKHDADAGTWILGSEGMRPWIDGMEKILWIYGIPGSGKTFLTSTILNRHVLPQAQDGVSVAYYYCDFRNLESCQPESVLGAIVVQLCKYIDPLPAVIEEIMSLHAGLGGRLTPPSLDELETLLKKVLRLCRAAIIVVDALDECQDRETVVKVLRDVSRTGPGNTKVLVTSREEPDIVRLLQGVQRISTRSSEADQDIERLIHSSLAMNRTLQKLRPSLKARIIEKLSMEACGMFRWVTCQLDELSRLRTDAAIKLALETLPRSLDETYERMLNRIHEHDKPLARNALLWLAYSRRPLSLQELAEGAVITADMQVLDTEDQLRDPEDILEVCGSLVSQEEGSYIVLSHNSLRDYLLSDRAAKNNPTFYLPERKSQIEVARRCLAYLLLQNFSSGPCTTADDMKDRLAKWPLLGYVAHNWADHARAFLESDPQLFRQATRLLSSESANFLAWVQLLFLRPRRVDQLYRSYPPQATPLYYACSFGLAPLVRYLIHDRGMDVKAPGGRIGSTPLHGACWRGHADVVRLLLEAGADPRASNDFGNTAMKAAAFGGNPEVVEMIMREVSKNGGDGGSPEDWGTNLRLRRGPSRLKVLI